MSPPDAYHYAIFGDSHRDYLPEGPHPLVELGGPRYSHTHSHSARPLQGHESDLPTPRRAESANPMMNPVAVVTGRHSTWPPLIIQTSSAMQIPNSGLPASAPPETTQFPFRIFQERMRTRSDQGEPPSATLYSPISPMVAPHMPIDDPHLHGTTGRLTFDPDDGSSWARRGLVDISAGQLLPFETSNHTPSSPLTIPAYPIHTAAGYTAPSTLPSHSHQAPSMSRPRVDPNARKDRRQSFGAPYVRPMSVSETTYQRACPSGVEQRDSQAERVRREGTLPSSVVRGMTPHHPFEGVLGDAHDHGS